MRLGAATHLRKRILGVMHHVVGRDGDGADAKPTQLFTIAHDAVDPPLDVSEGVAYEHPQLAVLAAQRLEAIGLAVGGRKGEGWRLPTEIANGSFFRHRSFRFRQSVIGHNRAGRKLTSAGHMAKPDKFCNRAEAYEANDDVPLSPADQDSIGDIILKRYSRREMMRGTLGFAPAGALFGPAALASRNARAETAADRFNFAEVAAGVDETHHVADGYQADILLRWGGPLFPDYPAFCPTPQTP